VSSGVLSNFIERHFVDIDAQILLSLVKDLGSGDIEEIYRRLRNEDRFTHSLQELAFALRLFTCNDSVPFNSASAARARIDSYRIPGLTRREGRMMAYELAKCDGFPTGSVPQTFHKPVTGDGSVPVMVFTGTNDIQTATSWSEQAAEQLIGSQFVRFPNTGHGATLFSQCARDVAAAFFDQPASKTNSDCKEELIPTFVLPDEPLP
jgi:pimeloyl-ACP methyl ester carboxylesterase